MPSSTVAIALAKSLDVSTSYLLSPSNVSLESVEFRKEASAKAKERAVVEAEVLDSVDRYLQIEQILGVDDSSREQQDWTPYDVRTVEDAEDAAVSLRVTWDLGSRPIPDITELLEERGIKIIKLRLPSTVDGLTCDVRRTDGNDFSVIVCSDEKSIERQRFTIAHELGHVIMKVSSEFLEEMACNRVAAAFLIPADELRREVGRHRLNFGFGELVEIKQKYGVSAAALVTRMQGCGLSGGRRQRASFEGSEAPGGLRNPAHSAGRRVQDVFAVSV